MQARQSISDSFSTYIRFEAGRFSGWLIEPRLRKSIEQAIARPATSQPSQVQPSQAQSSKSFWALYWHHHWQSKTHRLALAHLSAHVQEAAYWAAYKFTSRFESRQFSLADCFQVAFTQFEKGLSSFQRDRGVSLESFARLFFSSTITNELRRAGEVDLCSDWLLLRKTSRKRLIESLKNAGLDEAAIEQRRLALMCFNRLYAEQKELGTQQLSAPDPDTWQAIATLYNQERLTQLNSPTENLTASQLETWLTDCIKWIRRYLHPPVASLNAPLSHSQTGSQTEDWQDSLPAADNTPIEQLIQETEYTSRQAQQLRLRAYLITCFDQLAPPEQLLFQLYYKENLTQQKIAQNLEIKQYAVSRKLGRVRKKLLNGLLDWCAQTENIELSSDNIETVANMLESWLQDYFSQN